jgi:hypothetical protein
MKVNSISSNYGSKPVAFDLVSETSHEATLLNLIAQGNYKLEYLSASESAGTNEPSATHLTITLISKPYETSSATITAPTASASTN